MFKVVGLIVAAAVMHQYGLSPSVIAIVLTVMVLGFVVELEKRVDQQGAKLSRADTTSLELSDIQRDLTELRRDVEQSGRSTARMDWELGQRRDDTELKQIADDLASALARLDSLEAEARLRRSTAPLRA